MFAREVTVAGKSYTIWCTPTTPLSEVLRRAAGVAERQEREARDNDPDIIAYRAAVKALDFPQ